MSGPIKKKLKPEYADETNPDPHMFEQGQWIAFDENGHEHRFTHFVDYQEALTVKKWTIR